MLRWTCASAWMTLLRPSCARHSCSSCWPPRRRVSRATVARSPLLRLIRLWVHDNIRDVCHLSKSIQGHDPDIHPGVISSWLCTCICFMSLNLLPCATCSQPKEGRGAAAGRPGIRGLQQQPGHRVATVGFTAHCNRHGARFRPTVMSAIAIDCQMALQSRLSRCSTGAMACVQTHTLLVFSNEFL